MDVVQVLRKAAPKANSIFVQNSAAAGAILVKYGASGSTEQIELLTQFVHESMGLTHFNENMNYSAERLHQVFPGYFPSVAAAAPYAHNPVALANKVYANRMGNGPPSSGDGDKYHGHAALQHTGKSEHDRITRRTGVDVLNNPMLLTDPAHAELMWEAGITYMVDRAGTLEAAKRGDTRTVSIKVNGGTNGLNDRLIIKQRLTQALAGQTIDVSQRTVSEQADDAQKRAKNARNATVAAPAADGAGTSQAGYDWGTILAVVVITVVVLGSITVLLYKHFGKKKAALEVQNLLQLAQRAGIDPAAPPVAATA